MDLGFEAAGFDIVFVNEYQKAFLNAYQYARMQMNVSAPCYGYYNGDINDFLGIKQSFLKEHIAEIKSRGEKVGFIGGPPCPDFSVAGKNKGAKGVNGKLSSSYIDLIIDMKPDFFLFENVKGLWSTTTHRSYFEQLKDRLHQAGYATTERLTNALEFGVPQDRDRILLFGIRQELLHTPSNTAPGFPWEKYIRYDLQTIKQKNWPSVAPFHEGRSLSAPVNIIKELTVEYWFEKNMVLYHANAKNYFIPRAGIHKMKTINEGDVGRKSYKRLHRWRYSPTVAYGNNEVHLHPYLPRRLSVAEALAIQSLPAGFELPQSMSLTDMFKTVGNGVPYLMAKGIAESIADYMK